MRRSWRVISCPQPRRSGCSRFAGRNSGTGVSSRRRIRSGRGWLSGDHEKEAVPCRPAVAGSYETGVLIPVSSMSFPGRAREAGEFWNEAIWDSFFGALGGRADDGAVGLLPSASVVSGSTARAADHRSSPEPPADGKALSGGTAPHGSQSSVRPNRFSIAGYRVTPLPFRRG